MGGVVPPRQSDELTDASVLADYAIKSPLGSGTFATVVLVHHKKSKRDLCLKMIDKRLMSCPEEVARENRALHALSPHPRIVELVEILEGSEAHFVLTEVLHGGDLFDRIWALGGKVSESTAAQYTRDLLEALTHIHAHGWVHRDLKPENLLFINEQESSHMKVIDFGYATALEPGSQVADGNLLGTPHYLAPEMVHAAAWNCDVRRSMCVLQAMQQPYDHKVDVWAAGVIAHQMVFGELPWDDPDTEDSSETAEELWRRNKQLLLRINEAKIDRSDPTWGVVSDGFKEFLGQVLCKEIDSRLDAPSALAHQWVQPK